MVELQHIDAFRSALKDYQPSADTVKTLQSMPLVILLGVSGAGRNTIINHLVNSGNYHFILSDTTRPPKMRDGVMEQNGVQYFFRTEDEVMQDIVDGAFVEAEVIHNQQVSGINARVLKEVKDSGKIPINEVDLGGTIALHRVKPDTKFFFVIPPNFKEWMYRLKGREVISDQELHNRLQTAKQILTASLNNDAFTFVLNDSSYDSALRIDHQVRTHRNDQEHLIAMKAARDILQQLDNVL